MDVLDMQPELQTFCKRCPELIDIFLSLSAYSHTKKHLKYIPTLSIDILLGTIGRQVDASRR
jgi:hypothetical protein